MSNTFFLSDLHLGHKNILEFAGKYRNFGKLQSVDEHDEWVIEQINSVVTKRDKLFLLGDICFNGNKLHMLARINTINIELILGNHDKFELSSYYPYVSKIHGFRKYRDYWLSHAPIHPIELRGHANIHGHMHHNCVPNSNYINVSVEQLNGIPIAYEDLWNKEVWESRRKDNASI